ncbi:MAG: hypothetical protein EBS19_08450 [Spirochaetia bacterium]|nr:hypothetical protein [Spirochaetia bacterium]
MRNDDKLIFENYAKSFKIKEGLAVDDIPPTPEEAAEQAVLAASEERSKAVTDKMNAEREEKAAKHVGLHSEVNDLIKYLMDKYSSEEAREILRLANDELNPKEEDEADLGELMKTASNVAGAQQAMTQ